MTEVDYMKTPQEEYASNGFLAVLQRKETQVGTLSEASDLLSDAVKASIVTGKKATITLKLTVEPKQGALNFVTKLSTTLPVEEEPLCIFYSDEHGNLHRDDPTQKEFELREVSGGKSEDAPQHQSGAVAI